MIQSRREYLPSYGSSVEVARDLANSSATYRSNHNGYVNSSQYIKVEGSGSGKLSVESNSQAGGAAGYGSSNTIQSRNVPITTSRITTDKGEFGSGGAQITSSRYEGSSGVKNIGSTSTGAKGGYQFY